MRPITVSRTATGQTDPIVLDIHGRPEVSLQVEIDGTSATYTVQQTLDNVFTNNSPEWFDHPDASLVGATTNQQGNYGYIPFAVRLNVTAVSSATVRLTVIQAGSARA